MSVGGRRSGGWESGSESPGKNVRVRREGRSWVEHGPRTSRYAGFEGGRTLTLGHWSKFMNPAWLRLLPQS